METLSDANEARLAEVLNDHPLSQTLQDVIETLAGSSGSRSRRDALLHSVASLESISGTKDIKGKDPTHASDVARLVAPDLRHENVGGSLNTKDTKSHRDKVLASEAALACLDILTSDWECKLDASTLVSVTTYTNPQDPWTTDEAADHAANLLNPNKLGLEMETFIVESVLRDYLRQLFTKTTSKVTSTGRPAQFSNQRQEPAQGLDRPKWKSNGFGALSTLRWSVNAAEVNLLKENWPLFTPVLLTMIEDEDIFVKISALEILVTFLEKIPPTILRSTGLGTVFQETIFPILLHLPGLTPEEESARLMGPAYTALITMAKREAALSTSEKSKLLDKTLRDGILAAYSHASQYGLVVQALMRATSAIVHNLGIATVKHLQNLISMISAVMTDPFALSQPKTVAEAARTLNSIIANCWPRVACNHYHGEVMRIISTCWINVRDELSSSDSAAAASLNDELKTTAAMLQTLNRSSATGSSGESETILQKEPELQELFSS